MSTDLVTVGSFWSVLDAHLAKSRLEQEGIKAVLAGENVVAVMGCPNTDGSVKLQVKATDEEEARRILASTSLL